MSKIKTLTKKQELVLSSYKKKWLLAALNSETIDREKVTSIIERIHPYLSKSASCEIYFFDSPYEVANYSFLDQFYPKANWDNPRKFNNQLRIIENDLFNNILFCSDIFRKIWMPLHQELRSQVEFDLYDATHDRLHFWSPQSVMLCSLLDSGKTSPIWKKLKPSQQGRLERLWTYLAQGLETPGYICSLCCALDFYINELGCVLDMKLWQLLQDFAIHCGWTFFSRDFCFTCHRPAVVLFDEEMKIHAENRPAIRFRNGLEIFVENQEFITSRFGDKII
jgi:hypothetical protein